LKCFNVFGILKYSVFEGGVRWQAGNRRKKGGWTTQSCNLQTVF